MGKYLKKSNSNNVADVSLNFIDISAPLGVRTRAKTLASKTQKSTPSAAVSSSSFGYLQLRSRRLLRLKPPVFKQSRKSFVDGFPNSIGNPNLGNSSSPEDSSPNSRVRVGVCVDSINPPVVKRSRKPYDDFPQNSVGNPNLSNSSSPAGSNPNSRVRVGVDSPKSGDKLVSVIATQSANDRNNADEVDYACCGENVMELDDHRERSTRESTPSNMIQDSESIRTPGSTTRPASSPKTTRRLPSSTPRDIPTSHEMEEFFADAEEQQQKDFIQKYNFDPVNDKPLNGRYEWKKVKKP
ncbi:hypothetical protein RND81_12G035000 [Saponaria officinalis]|uniref:Cyclin-dependent kinase inhibitor domain-containing protein n=1 Tax=Saponaria officinalis TaxID=3572 RepID=A0AAW1H512_SAPOF